MPSLPQGCVSRDEEVQGGIEMAGIKHKKVKPYSVEGFESFAKFCESDEKMSGKNTTKRGEVEMKIGEEKAFGIVCGWDEELAMKITKVIAEHRRKERLRT